MRRNQAYLWSGSLSEFERVGFIDVDAADWFGCYDMGGEL